MSQRKDVAPSLSEDEKGKAGIGVRCKLIYPATFVIFKKPHHAFRATSDFENTSSQSHPYSNVPEKIATAHQRSQRPHLLLVGSMAVDEITPLLIGNLPIDSEPVRKITQPLVDFDPVIDEDNPLDWPRAYKNGVVALLAFMAFTM